MMADGAVSSTANLYGLIGLIVTGSFGVVVAIVTGRWRTNTDEDDLPRHRRSPERTAADTTSQEILDWIEEHTVVPMRQDITDLRAETNKLLKQIGGDTR
jgi:hypothetical protein